MKGKDRFNYFPLRMDELQLLIEAVGVYDDLWEKREFECEEDVADISSIRDVAQKVLRRLKVFKNSIKEKTS